MKRLVSVLAVAAMVAAACGGTSSDDDDPVQASEAPATSIEIARSPAVATVDDIVLSELVAGNTELALELFANLAMDGGNVLVAPASISEGLALPFLGARGATAIEMANVLKYSLQGDELHAALATLRKTLESRQNDQLEIRVANRAFGQEGFGFLDEFLADLSRWYESPLATLDLNGDPGRARAEINRWTSEQTNDRIPELFPRGSIDSNARLVLVNAVYMAADWFYPFNPEATAELPFTLLDGSEVMVETMNFNEFLPSGTGAGWSAVQIPYAGEDLSMIVVVPKNLEIFLSNLHMKRLGNIRKSIEHGGIHLYLPKFELSYHTSLVDPLRELGMALPFDGSADFSGMTGSPNLFIDGIEHETFIKVDEVGTEAAGATGSIMALSHGPTVTVDRPFIFFIQDDATGAILFLGQVTDPRG